jgi:translation initiation factor IF-1
MSTLLHTTVYMYTDPLSYRGALLSTLLHATVYMFLHNFLNVLVHIANKMRFKKIMKARGVVGV